MENKTNTMLDYIRETPKIVIENAKRSKELTGKLTELFLKGNYNKLVIVASGSSFNSSHCAKYFIKDVLGIDVKILSPYTFNSYESKIQEDEFVIVISQSGFSTNSIDSLKVINNQKKESIGLTSDINSDFKEFASHLIDYGCGIETVGYVTKGVVTLAEFLMLFSIEVAVSKNIITNIKKEDYVNQIIGCMDIYQEITENTLKFYKANYLNLTSMSNAYVCGAGPSYGTALEGALKIGETVQIPSIAFEIEEYLHGPNLQLTPLYTTFFMDNDDETTKRTLEIYNATRAITDRAFIITNDKSIDDSHALRHTKIKNPMLSPLCHLSFFQVISYMVTDDLKKWNRHPLYNIFKEKVACKTESYVDRD